MARATILEAIRNFDAFNEGNDPYGERDFVSVSVAVAGGELNVLFKIDYFSGSDCNYGSDNPADPNCTFRVGTIMLASEY